MIRNALLFLGALVVLASTGHSQTGGKKKGDPGEVEMTFANGSVVRMALLPEKIEINTAFGKLTVPVREIRRIDFGLHMPPGTDKKIEASIGQLASTDYKEREAALRELVALGAYAYPALIQAAKGGGELETVKRAQDALAKIKAQVSAKELRLSEDDKVVTSQFTIVGRIITGSLKAKSEYFGDVELALTKLRHLRVLIDARDGEVVVDAGKYAQPNQWLDTGIVVDSAANLAILASGEVDLRPSLAGNQVCGPRGYNAGGFAGAGGFGGKAKKGGGVLARSYPGTLLGRIGELGETFIVGERFEGATDREGKLYLQIVSSPYDNVSSGSYKVKISVQE